MAGVTAVHQCLFCPQIFNTAADKDDHVLRHFAQENCTECNQNLIRIGDKLYTLHDAVTCIQRPTKIEHHSTDPINDAYISDFSNVYTENDNHLLNDASVKSESFSRIDELDDIEDQSHDIRERNHFDPHCSTVKEEPIEPCVDIIENELSLLQIPEFGVLDSECVMSSSNDFRCELCDKSFKTFSIQKEHMRKTHDPNVVNYKCGQCYATFRRESSFQNHGCNPEQIGIECDECGKVLRNKVSLSKHKILNHSSADTIVCNRCYKIFDSQDELDTHKINCASKRDKGDPTVRFECEFCSEVFIRRDTFRRHVRKQHDSAYRFKCEKCNKSYLQELTFLNHKCSMNEKKTIPIVQDKPKIDTKQKIDKNRSVTCEICGLVLSLKSIRRHRIRFHSSENQCNVCGKKFDMKDEYNEHQSKCSTERRIRKRNRTHGVFECDICKMKFKSKEYIYRHMRIRHDPNSDKFRCKTCGLFFMRESSVVAHHCRGPFKREPSACEFCGKILNDKSALRKHQKAFHSNGGLRRPRRIKNPAQTECDVCGKKFAESHSLKRHKVSFHRTPDTIFCRICIKVFETVDELNVHWQKCGSKQRKPRNHE